MSDDMANNVLATGGISAALLAANLPEIEEVRLVTMDGQATNQLVVKFGFLKSSYKVTIERLVEEEHRTTCSKCGGPYDEEQDSWGVCYACWEKEPIL